LNDLEMTEEEFEKNINTKIEKSIEYFIYSKN